MTKVLTAQDYSQCLPGTASTTAVKSTMTTSLVKTTTTSAKPTITTSSTKTLVSVSTTTTAAVGPSTGYPGTTLQTGYYWIRAVEAPNFHQYLTTAPMYVAGTAILGNYTSAGQFQIVNGQLVELIAGGLLYANVEMQENSTVTKLGMTFEATQNTYGTFAFSGDAVQWTVPSINRPNPSAWLVCGGQQLFINLGNYDYLTPAGCADETVRSGIDTNDDGD